jgi:Membrane protease subunits, stomatin/prohibitin homologs
MKILLIYNLTKKATFMYLSIFLIFLIATFLIFSVVIVPQQQTFVVERLGKYHNSLSAGLHFIFPFVDRIRAKVDSRETVLDVPPQVCITKDNTQVTVDGVLYVQVTEPKLAVYGTNNYISAVSSLAQTSLRSIIGKMNLDDTVESREIINSKVVSALDEAAVSWGVKLLRYEIRDLTPPEEIIKAMQDQITADREKRAKIIASEAEKIEKINIAQGQKESMIRISEGEKESALNMAEAQKVSIVREAEAQAERILLNAKAEADSIKTIANALLIEGGHDAMNLQIAQKYIEAYSNIAKESTTIITPNNPLDVSSAITTALTTINKLNVNKE